MRAFVDVLERLLLSPARGVKLRLLAAYFKATPDPDRGYALAAIAGGLSLPNAKPSLLRALVTARVDPELFALSYDYVGDLAETIALIWPARPGTNRAPELSEVVEGLSVMTRAQAGLALEGWLDGLDARGRWGLLKLVTGGLRIGAGARLAKQALADWGAQPVEAIEEIWHGLTPPYESLFAWLEGRGPKPAPSAAAPFRPVMLAHPLEAEDRARLDASNFAAEFKWDGVRVQAVQEAGVRRLYSRSGEDLSAAFPDLVEALDFDGVLDGELLVQGPDGQPAPFADLQKRLNRKSPDKKLLAALPAMLRAYDLLFEGGQDLRPLPFSQRRARLEAFVPTISATRIDLSPLAPGQDWISWQALRDAPPQPAIEGLMLKRWDSPYLAGRPTGPWWKWKRAPMTADCVLMYAQRGHGKRSSLYSDFTFGCWTADGQLAPVGKAYFGFTDAELTQLDQFVRDNTVERFGPVRGVRADAAVGLVLEVAFDGLARSSRHRSGLAMRFPRIARIRWDKPPAEADTLEGLVKLLG
jgi:DNA ligase 1